MMKNDEPPSQDKYLQSFQVTDKLEMLIIEWRPPQGAPFFLQVVFKLFKPRKNTLKFLRYYIKQQDTWFSPFKWYDIRVFLEKFAKMGTNEEHIQHQLFNFTYYLVNAGYIENCNPKGVMSINSEYRITIKGYDFANDNYFQRHPQITGIIIGASLSFLFATVESFLDKSLWSNELKKVEFHQSK